MSRIGKKPIAVPNGVKVAVAPAGKGNLELKVQGPKGELNSLIKGVVSFNISEKEITVKLNPKFSHLTALWGTARAVLNNMIQGVTEGFSKQLELQGTGYKMNLEGKDLVLEVGFSHPVRIAAPAGIEFAIEKNILTISGIDKQLVGETAARIRKVRAVEPYKGKGLRYVGEIVRRKEGKKAVGETA
ncbi:MAG: 50S ribosomal protein L6 [Candidatus Moranbacteria bacterium]|nr:50S ribosomal protein L6 [Candidatus Moranbacteria bacterium]